MIDESFDDYSEDYSEDYLEDSSEDFSEDFPENSEIVDEFPDETNLTCDTCDRSFYSHEMLQNHLAQHRVCGIDGCTFVAHEKIVEKHIEMQHVTGLYYRMKHVQTPEEILAWIAERKRKYPTKENIEKRYKQQEEMLKRGERIGKPKSRFGKPMKKVLVKPKLTQRFPRKRMQPKKFPPAPTSLLSSKESWNGNLLPFAGTSELYENEPGPSMDIDDDEWCNEESTDNPIVLNNALGALIGAYRSDESDDEISVPKVAFEPPAEEKILRTTEDKPGDVSDRKPRKRQRKRRNSKEKTKVPEETVERKARVFRRKVTLLEKLLAPDIRHERNVILQCVRHVVQNDFFDNN